METITELIPNALVNERIDKVVALFADTSRSGADELIASGDVTLDGVVVKKGSQRVEAEQELIVVLPDATPNELIPDPDVVFDVVFADDDVIVVNKPAGLIVHPGAGVHDKTLVNGLLAQFPEIANVGERTRPGIVHRLDAGTSGLLVVARSAPAYDSLVTQLSQHSAQREYLALSRGSFENDAGTIDAPIGRSSRVRTRMGVVAEGKDARTHYTVIERFNTPSAYTLVHCQLETGRTHQIRVHLAAIGHPVVGDDTYGGSGGSLAAPRPMLHATRLSFSHPITGETGEFSIDPPQDFTVVVDRLRTEAQ